MRKCLAVITILTLSIFLLSGCKSNAKNKTPGGSSSSANKTITSGGASSRPSVQKSSSGNKTSSLESAAKTPYPIITPEPAASVYTPDLTGGEPTQQPTFEPLPEEWFPEINSIGNTNGNVANAGYVSRQGEWVYYYSVLDNGLYKMRNDKSDKVKLFDGFVDNINVSGDWVYFVHTKADFNNPGSILGKLYKVKTDGSGLTRINDIDYRVSNLIIINEWIYYTSDSEYNVTDGTGLHKIFKVNINDSSRYKLTDDSCANIQIEDDWLYYSSDRRLYKIKTDGSEKTSLIDEQIVSRFVLDSGMIYYTNASDENRIYKIDIAGNSGSKVTENRSGDFNVSNGSIYFSNQDDRGALYKISVNGGEIIRLNKDSTYKVSVIGNMIYYITSITNKAPLVRILINGSLPRELFN